MSSSIRLGHPGLVTHVHYGLNTRDQHLFDVGQPLKTAWLVGCTEVRSRRVQHELERAWVNVVCVAPQLSILVMVFISLASLTFIRSIPYVDVETAFTASTAVLHLDVCQLLPHVVKQRLLSQRNSGIPREIDVHPFGVITKFVVNYWFHRYTLSVVHSLLFGILVYRGRTRVSRVRPTSSLQECQTACMQNPTRRRTRDRCHAV
jgi:hypothetical protein